LDEHTNELVAALVVHLESQLDGVISEIAINPQGNGECPYRVFVRGEALPDVGLATKDSV
jgi:hypothetical protein